jgi:hypothetical protein
MFEHHYGDSAKGPLIRLLAILTSQFLSRDRPAHGSEARNLTLVRAVCSTKPALSADPRAYTETRPLFSGQSTHPEYSKHPMVRPF